VRARAILALSAMVSSLSLAAAQTAIPPSEMPGRERDRFIESPLERFMRPGPFVQPPVVDKPKSRRGDPRRSKRPRKPR
jgi:hypothetical protein